MKTDLVAAVGIARVNLARAFDPYLAFQKDSAGMHNCTCAALTCHAMANIDAIRFARCDDPQRPAVAQCRSFHCLLPSSFSRFCPAPHISPSAPPTSTGLAIRSSRRRNTKAPSEDADKDGLCQDEPLFAGRWPSTRSHYAKLKS